MPKDPMDFDEFSRKRKETQILNKLDGEASGEPEMKKPKFRDMTPEMLKCFNGYKLLDLYEWACKESDRSRIPLRLELLRRMGYPKPPEDSK